LELKKGIKKRIEAAVQASILFFLWIIRILRKQGRELEHPFAIMLIFRHVHSGHIMSSFLIVH
jgi:hypothetical protein